MKKVLTFWIGEFGFEIMGFIPNLKRRLKEEYQGWEVHSASYRGREVMYRDIYSKFHPIDLTPEEKKEISLARLSSFNTNHELWSWKRRHKIHQILMGKEIFKRTIGTRHYDDVIFSTDEINERSLSSRSKIFEGWGIYEHMKCGNFPVEREIGNNYAVVFPRADGGKHDKIPLGYTLPAQQWNTLIDMLKQRGITTLYYHQTEGHKATVDIKGAIKINDLGCYSPSNSVNLQLYLLKNAKFVISSQVGALHLAVFAPAKFILAYFNNPKWFNFDWQWDLIPKKNVDLLESFNFSPQGAIDRLIIKGVL